MFKFKLEDFAYKSGNIFIFDGDKTVETLAKSLGEATLEMSENLTLRCRYPQKKDNSIQFKEAEKGL